MVQNKVFSKLGLTSPPMHAIMRLLDVTYLYLRGPNMLLLDSVLTVVQGVDFPLASKIMAARIGGVGVVEVNPLELATVVSQFNRNEATSSQIVTETLPRWQGGKKNPVVSQYGDPARIVKVSRYNCNMGIWASQIDKRVDREVGEDVPDYKPLPPKGKEYVGDSPLMVKSSDPQEKYLSVIPMGCWCEVKFMLDGVELPDLSAEQYSWKGKSRVERHTGLKRSDVPRIRTPKLSNVKVLAPWGRDESGRFQPVELIFKIRG